VRDRPGYAAPERSGYAVPERPELLRGLRTWQREAHTAYFAAPRRDFLLVATPVRARRCAR